ncbi:cupin domain-containing protein [Ochrobactrum sp. EDr1-4]|uniref:cupin domain-containing protein n=1 Tax=Ochrobactrum sp. EDr1-4 TaxID=3368622 RepID=UPI003BA0CDE3
MKRIHRISALACETDQLESCAFVPLGAALSINPIEKGALHFTDSCMSAGTWEATPYSEILEMRGASEYAIILSGALTITDGNGVRYEFASGDSYVLTDGFVGRFEVTWTMPKTYVLIEGSKQSDVGLVIVA